MKFPFRVEHKGVRGEWLRWSSYATHENAEEAIDRECKRSRGFSPEHFRIIDLVERHNAGPHVRGTQ